MKKQQETSVPSYYVLEDEYYDDISDDLSGYGKLSDEKLDEYYEETNSMDLTRLIKESK